MRYSSQAAFLGDVVDMKWLLFAFIVLPTIELVLMIYSGQLIGFFPTVSLILLTSIFGAYFAKRQGMKAWLDLKNRMASMETPGDALIDSFCIFIAGVLLIMPGFITDLIGVLLLFRWTRNKLRPFIQNWIYKRMKKGQIIIR